MRRSCLACVAVMTVIVAATAWEAHGEPAPVDYEKLVAQLASESYAEREAATKALAEAGESALPALRRALLSNDLEVRRRAEEIVQRVERRREQERILAPRLVTLDLKDAPIGAAVEELKKQSGYSVELEGNLSGLENRRVTLKTEGKPFWEALALFCERSGLVEASLVKSTTPAKEKEDLERRRLERVIGGQPMPTVTQVRLRDGEAPKVPSTTVGALQLRVLPGKLSSVAQSKTNGEVTLAVDVRVEPSLQLLTVLGLEVEHAVDENGLPLTQPTPFVAELAQNLPWMGNRVMMINGVTMGGPMGGSSSQVPLRLKLTPGQDGKMAKEIRGKVGVMVVTPVMPLVTIPDLTKDQGNEFDLGGGGVLKILSVQRDEAEGGYKVQLQLDGLSANNMNRWVAGRFQSGMDNLEGLDICDEHGQPCKVKVVGSDINAMGIAISQTVTLSCTPSKNDAKLGKFVYKGRKNAALEIPFRFVDVPLN